MVMSQLRNVEGAKVQNIRNVEEVVKETIEAHVDFLETVTGTIKVDLEVTIVLKIICKEKNSMRNPRKVQPKDQTGSTLEQDLSSLLVQLLMQENEELRKKVGCD